MRRCTRNFFLIIIAHSLLWEPASTLQIYPISSSSHRAKYRRMNSNGCHHQQRYAGNSNNRQIFILQLSSTRSDGNDGVNIGVKNIAASETDDSSSSNDKSLTPSQLRELITTSPIKQQSKRPIISTNNNNSLHTTTTSASTMSTALCIVPPDDAWDTIQRARHLARDTTFYKWPPAIRLFHPFAPKKEIPNLVGELAEWMETQDVIMDSMEFMLSGEEGCDSSSTDTSSTTTTTTTDNNILSSFEVTLDSILILPHFEVLDARIEALEKRKPQDTLGTSFEEEEYQKRKAEGLRLIEEEERKGLERKIERERKRKLKNLKKAGRKPKKKVDDQVVVNGSSSSDDADSATTTMNQDDPSSKDSNSSNDKKKSKSSNFNGPCVIYLSPNDESRIRLTTLRERLRCELFDVYNDFSPSSSVSPYPEQLPRKVNNRKMASPSSDSTSQFRPLLPIARFATVQGAVKVAKVLQQTWDPLTFNVTDLQFVSRDEETAPHHVVASTASSASGVGFGKTKQQKQYETDDMDIPEVRHRRKHGTFRDGVNGGAPNQQHHRMALTTSGEVEDVSKRGIYGCDAMVMLLGEEPEEEIMDDEASLSMIMDNDDEDGDNDDYDHIGGKIDYNEIFSTAEREYQRMQAQEELETASYVGDVPIFDSSVTDIEAWLDGNDDEDEIEDEGATVVVGRAQFFMGAMREFIG